MIKNIRSFFIDEPASYLPQFKFLKKKFNKIEKEKIYTFGNKNKDKTFYVINRSPGAGFFSNLNFILNYILYAIKKKYVPIIDMKNFPTIYNEIKKISNNSNAWEYYFKKINKYKLSEVYKSRKIIFSSSFLKRGMSLDILANKEFIKIKKLIEIKNSYIKESKNFIKKNFKKNEKILGVHLRGTSYKIARNHPFPIPKEMMANVVKQIIKKEKVNKIFLCTEDENYFKYFKNIFKGKLIFLESYRTNKIDAFKIYPRKNHRYKLGKEILIETLILSNCENLVFVNSNVIDAAIFFSKKKQKKYEIFLGQNSNNKLIAKRLWSIKNFLPHYLGGFNNNIKLEDLLNKTNSK